MAGLGPQAGPLFPFPFPFLLSPSDGRARQSRPISETNKLLRSIGRDGRLFLLPPPPPVVLLADDLTQSVVADKAGTSRRGRPDW